MSGEPNRNARCHCGSGKKFKNCHGAAQVTGSGRKIPLGYILMGAVAAAVAVFVFLKQSGSTTPPGAAPPGKVWSEEHNHWHDAP
jgi:hypothetical protein